MCASNSNLRTRQKTQPPKRAASQSPKAKAENGQGLGVLPYAASVLRSWSPKSLSAKTVPVKSVAKVDNQSGRSQTMTLAPWRAKSGKCLLETVRRQTFAAVKKSVKAPTDVVAAAIGWLAREDKLEFTSSGKTVKISLK